MYPQCSREASVFANIHIVNKVIWIKPYTVASKYVLFALVNTEAHRDAVCGHECV